MVVARAVAPSKAVTPAARAPQAPVVMRAQRTPAATPKIYRKTAPDPRFQQVLRRLEVSVAEGRSAIQRSPAGGGVDADLKVSAPGDASEREAESVAARIVQMPSPTGVRPSRRTLGLQRMTTGGAASSTGGIAADLRSSLGSGTALPASVRGFMEPRFGADFGDVKVHVDERASRMSAQLGAQAFTYAGHIFFARGAYAPESPAGRLLLAHELVHVIQQGAASRSRDDVGISQRSPVQVQRLGLSDILDGLADLAANVPGYTLLTLIIGRNPINMRVVERTAVNVLRAFMGLIPGGEILFQILDRYGVMQRLGDWVNQQTSAMGLTFQSIRDAFSRFIDSLHVWDIARPGDVWRRAQDIFTPTVTRIRSFVGGLITQAITWLKETFLQPVSNFCREIPGYTLVTVLLGRDPFTSAPVSRTALNVVRAFAEFIPGGTEKVNQLVESRGLQNAYEWFVQETQARNLTWARVTGTFTQAWASLRLEDVLHPIDTLQRIVTMFRPLMSDLIGFAGAALMKLLEVIFEAVMGAGGARILSILKRARSTFLLIIRDPVAFLRNLLRGVGQGIRQFGTNILAHLRTGVIAWLTGPVARAGIQMPERWDARGIIWFVLQILGLTWDRVRQKLVRLLGDRVVAALETGFQLIQEIRERGLFQALRDRVTEYFGQLRESALGAIRSFIQQRLVMAGITQLVSMLNPVGAVIQAIIKTYTTVQFFIQRINQILDIVESIVDSISAIASGSVGAAANFIERTMARTIPVLLDFLARFIGLGDVGGQVQRTIQGLQARVDQMLDRAVDWIRAQAQRLAQLVIGLARRGATAVRSAIRRARDWWSMRKAVTTRDGHRHEIHFAGSGTSARLMISSTPQSYLPYLDTLKTTFNLTDASLAAARAKARDIDTERARTVPEAERDAQVTTINAMVDQLATLTQNLPLTAAGGTNTPPVYGPLRQGFGTFARVVYLQYPFTAGSDPSVANTTEYDDINIRRQGSGSYYIKGHLLNENLGGPGTTWSNLTPLSQAANGDHKNSFENPIKMVVNGALSGNVGATLGNCREFNVAATYGRSVNETLVRRLLETDDVIPGLDPAADRKDAAKVLRAERFVPTSLVCSAQITPSGGATRSITHTVNNNISYGQLNQYSFNASPKSRFVLADHIDWTKASNPADEAQAAAGLQVLNLVGAARAIRIFRVLNTAGRIRDYTDQIGISKSALEDNNPRYSIIAGTKP